MAERPDENLGKCHHCAHAPCTLNSIKANYMNPLHKDKNTL